MTLSPLETKALAVAAKIINCDPAHLKAVIAFESGWNPLIKNPTSSARGLIQFMDKTARDLGYEGSDQLLTLHPTRESQLLGPVVRYFRSIGSSFPNLQSVAMGIFYPAYRYEPETKTFPEAVQRANPGIKTVADYMAKVRAKA